MKQTEGPRAPRSPDADIEVGILISSLWRGRWWIGGGALLLALVFAMVALVTTPVYRATTILVPVSSDGIASGLSQRNLGSIAGVASLIGVGLDAGVDVTDEAIAVLKSRGFLFRFLQDFGIVPVIFRDLWDEKAQAWHDPDDAPTLEAAYRTFVESILTVSEDTRSGLVTIHVDWRDRAVAAQWANTLVERLNSYMRERALAQADASLQYLKEELQQTNQVGTQDAINRLIEGQINRRMLASVTKEFSFRVVDRAMPPDEHDVLRPRRTLLVAVGLVLGAALGAAGVLVAAALRGRQ